MADIFTRNQSGMPESPPGESPEKMKEIITEIEDVLFNKNYESKSNLISPNVEGIVQISCHNIFLRRRFGITNDVRAGLADSKLKVVKSRDAHGVQNTIHGLNSLKSEMNMMPAPAPGPLENIVGLKKRA